MGDTESSSLRLRRGARRPDGARVGRDGCRRSPCARLHTRLDVDRDRSAAAQGQNRAAGSAETVAQSRDWQRDVAHPCPAWRSERPTKPLLARSNDCPWLLRKRRFSARRKSLYGGRHAPSENALRGSGRRSGARPIGMIERTGKRASMVATHVTTRIPLVRMPSSAQASCHSSVGLGAKACSGDYPGRPADAPERDNSPRLVCPAPSRPHPTAPAGWWPC